MKTLFIGGDFDDRNGRSSKIAEQIFKSMNLENADYRNGGHYNDLLKMSDRIARYGLVFWLAKIPEDKPSVSAILKKRYNSFVLVSSIRNSDNKYEDLDLVSNALKIKSNLFVEFSEQAGRYYARIMDPLGNVFLDKNSDMGLVGKVLDKRSKELASYTRMNSECVGEKISAEVNEQFLNLIKGYAEKFTNFVCPTQENKERFMGNASFRCTSGFPSFKKDSLIFVSRRNIDKKEISSDSFSAVELDLEPFVGFYGVKKPSVDTPIQLKLYQNYSNINFMLHSHAYIRDASFTDRIIPCGAVEEAEDIIKIVDNKNVNYFAVNLRGHGSLFASSNLNDLMTIPYYARPLPEIHEEYSGDLK